MSGARNGTTSIREILWNIPPAFVIFQYEMLILSKALKSYRDGLAIGDRYVQTNKDLARVSRLPTAGNAGSLAPKSKEIPDEVHAIRRIMRLDRCELDRIVNSAGVA